MITNNTPWINEIQNSSATDSILIFSITEFFFEYVKLLIIFSNNALEDLETIPTSAK